MVGAEKTSAQAGQNPTVVELFTSQGCSSCPPADELLGELGKRPDLLVFSLPVDYWDYIGWKDTFATPANTARQRSYSHSLHHRSIYTPEMIVGGVYDVVGSDRGAVNKAIAKAQGAPTANIPVTIDSSDGGISVTVGEGKAARPATVWLVRYDPEHTVAIRAGENDGRRIAYHNVVRSMTSVGMWSGQAMSIAVKSGTLADLPGEQTAVIVQYGQTGPIIGAADMNRQSDVKAVHATVSD